MASACWANLIMSFFRLKSAMISAASYLTTKVRDSLWTRALGDSNRPQEVKLLFTDANGRSRDSNQIVSLLSRRLDCK